MYYWIVNRLKICIFFLLFSLLLLRLDCCLMYHLWFEKRIFVIDLIHLHFNNVLLSFNRVIFRLSSFNGAKIMNFARCSVTKDAPFLQISFSLELFAFSIVVQRATVDRVAITASCKYFITDYDNGLRKDSVKKIF